MTLAPQTRSRTDLDPIPAPAPVAPSPRPGAAPPPAAVDLARLEALVGRAMGDLSSAYAGLMITFGHKLGLYRAMKGAGPLGAAEIAARAGCAARYVREWLSSQVAGGYIAYDPASDTFALTAEQALVLAEEDSPAFIPHAWNVPASMWADEEKTLRAFRTGAGISWGEHDHRLYHGVAAFYRNAYRANLVSSWLPALEGVVARLRAGAAVADVGCGHGHSTVLMAEAFPRSTFRGFDPHQGSIDTARRNAAAAGVGERVTFATARADGYAGGPYDLICFFDCLHDLGDPIGALRHAAAALAPGGAVMLVEPFAADRLEGKIDPVAQLYYGGSTVLCCPHAVSEGGELVLGAQAGQARLNEVLRRAGFTHVRAAVTTPFNLILEARR
jgi:SAM-dependent methyltransferase